MPGNLNRLAHNRRVARIARLPQRVTQHHIGHGIRARLFFEPKEPSQQRLYAQQVKVVRGYVGNIDPLWHSSIARQRDPIVVIGEDPHEAAIPFAQIAVIEIREGGNRRDIPLTAFKAHQLLSIARPRNRMQHRSINPAKNGAVGAESQREHQYSSNRKPRALAKLPECIADILKQSTHTAPPIFSFVERVSMPS
jgi:hypothetical protein